MINAADQLEVMQVSNGYLVCPKVSPGMTVGFSDSYVFQTFAELTLFLAEHFTVRTTEIEVDK